MFCTAIFESEVVTFCARRVKEVLNPKAFKDQIYCEGGVDGGPSIGWQPFVLELPAPTRWYGCRATTTKSANAQGCVTSGSLASRVLTLGRAQPREE